MRKLVGCFLFFNFCGLAHADTSCDQLDPFQNLAELRTATLAVTQAVPTLPGDFKVISSRDGSPIGFSLKTGKVKVDLVTKVAFPQYFSPRVNFEGVRDLFRSKGRKVLYIVVGAYHDREKKVEGFTLDDGVSVGYLEFFQRHSAAVEIKDGAFQFHDLQSMGANQRNMLMANAKNNKSDMYQQHFALRDQVPTSTRPGSPSGMRYKMRFLVEYTNGDRGIIQFDKQFQWSEAMNELLVQTVKNAVYWIWEVCLMVRYFILMILKWKPVKVEIACLVTLKETTQIFSSFIQNSS